MLAVRPPAGRRAQGRPVPGRGRLAVHPAGRAGGAALDRPGGRPGPAARRSRPAAVVSVGLLGVIVVPVRLELPARPPAARPAHPARRPHDAGLPRPPGQPAVPVLPDPAGRRPDDAAQLERPGARDPHLRRAVGAARRLAGGPLPRHPVPRQLAAGRRRARPRRPLPRRLLRHPARPSASWRRRSSARRRARAATRSRCCPAWTRSSRSAPSSGRPRTGRTCSSTRSTPRSRRGRLDAAVDSTMGTLRFASPLVILAVGAYQVLRGPAHASATCWRCRRWRPASSPRSPPWSAPRSSSRPCRATSSGSTTSCAPSRSRTAATVRRRRASCRATSRCTR